MTVKCDGSVYHIDVDVGTSRIYSVPEADEQDESQPLNYSAHPSMLDSVSDIYFPARSSTSTDQSSISNQYPQFPYWARYCLTFL